MYLSVRKAPGCVLCYTCNGARTGVCEPLVLGRRRASGRFRSVGRLDRGLDILGRGRSDWPGTFITSLLPRSGAGSRRSRYGP